MEEKEVRIEVFWPYVEDVIGRYELEYRRYIERRKGRLSGK